jgi:uncharacterized protein
MPTYRILALDGGGIRGIYTAVLLDRLAKEVPGFIERADLIAGTSTGAILALGLAQGMTPADLIAYYQNEGAKIFSRTVWHEIRDLGELIGAKYDNSNLIQSIQSTFKDRTLNDLLPRHVLISSFDLQNDVPSAASHMWKPKFFHNFEGDQSDGDQKIADVALRTTAAPTYFPSYQGYVDGGVVANNPSMAALAQAIDSATGKQQLADLRLFSVGTGLTPVSIPGGMLDWGLAQWAWHLEDMIMEGMMGVADYECKRLLADRYFRLVTVLPDPIPLDGADKIPDLIAAAKDVDIREAVSWLSRNF